MGQLEKLRATFSDCAGSFSFRDFERLIVALGYEEVKIGKTAGSRRRYHHPVTQHTMVLHRPHNDEMKPGMVSRLRGELQSKGALL